MGLSDSDASNMYHTPWLSDFFHGFPHLNMKFKRINATFHPDSTEYQQSLGFWVAVPLVCCAFIWLLFTIYFIIRCCQKLPKSRQKPSSCPRISTGLLVFTAIAVLGFGFYENEEAHSGFEKARYELINANATIADASNEVNMLDKMAEEVSTHITMEIEQIIRKHTDVSIQKAAMKQIDHIRMEANSVRGYLQKVTIKDDQENFNEIISLSEDVEYYRWMITIVVYVLYVFLLAVTILGLLSHSGWLLMVSTLLCVFSSLFIWTTTGVYLGASVALGDLCWDPDTYVIDLAYGKVVEKAVVAYVKCKDTAQPYQQDIVNAQTSVTQAITALNVTVKLAKPLDIPQLKGPVSVLRSDLKFAMGNLSSLLTSVGMCSNIHQDYVRARDALCQKSILSTALLTLVSCVVALTCTVIVLTLSCLWRQYAVRRSKLRYAPVDDTDPFLPGPPPYESDYGTMGQSVSIPWSERGTLQHSNTPEDQVMMLRNQPLPLDDSPPPAYHPGKYMHQYADSGPTPSSIRHQMRSSQGPRY